MFKAKDKIDGIRHPKTGGGPAPLTQAEEALYQAMDTCPTIVGFVGGLIQTKTFINGEKEEEKDATERIS